MVVMVSDITWIRRGVAKTVPEKVKLDMSALKELVEGEEVHETTDMGEESETDAEEKKATEKEPVGLRGSGGSEVKDEKMDDEDDDVKEYLKEYDNEEEDGAKGNALKGVAVFANNQDDPYMTNANDSDEEEDKADFELKENDNLVAVAKIDQDAYTLEVYVYNEADADWYVHHDYILSAPPLCLEPLNYDPGNDEGEGKGNLLAVGTMESNINIWDLDIVNAVEPVVTLGAKESKKSRKKRDGSAQGHSDAVLCMHWNRLTRHVLASGGADKTVVLWDLDQAKCAQIVPGFDREVQSLQWHPAESTIFVAGTMGGAVLITDCRNVEAATPAKWQFETQIEKVIWDHFNPFALFVASDDGYLRYLDSRNTAAPVWQVRAHEASCESVALSPLTRGLVVSVGLDQNLAVWKHGAEGLSKVYAEKFSLGDLHSVSFCPDSSSVIAVGGELHDLVRTVDLAKIETVMQAFS